MTFLKNLLLWLSVVVGVSVAALAWHPIVGDSHWTASIRNGELVLVAITLLASAVAYSGMATVTGGVSVLKVFVIGPGTLALVLAIAVYVSFSQSQGKDLQDDHKTAVISYVFFATSLPIGAAALYITDRAQDEDPQT